MALANKCDRCGKLYERTTSSDKYFIRKKSPYAICQKDLCQKEIEKFMKFGNYIERGENK